MLDRTRGVWCAGGLAFALALSLALAVACDSDSDFGFDSATDTGSACRVGETDCSGVCVDTDSDLLNCGSCGNACVGDELCNAGSCEVPVVIFDSQNTPFDVDNTRAPGQSCGTQLVVGANDVTVYRIAVYTDMASAGNMKYLIFDHSTGDTLVFESAPEPFADDGASPTWKVSNPMSFTLLAGRTYCIAGSSDVSGDFKEDLVANSAGGLTSTVMNPDLDDYAAPVVIEHRSADCGIQLYGLP
jgi:hypothetical protein